MHLVWATWDRRPILDDARARRVHGLLDRLCIECGCVPFAIGGVEDHVHVLVGLRPSLAVSDLVRSLKVGTSQFIAHRLRVPAFAWQKGYGAFSLREAEREVVHQYVLRQREHHTQNNLIDDWERTDDAP
ncbi:MAG: IS200/IS605 family transposase [Deltaproteobacteria bacterium]|nr:IS200/IS605 family transposase [Deltaproteobacteria bacterium]